MRGLIAENQDWMIRRVESIERIQREQREFTPRKRPGTATHYDNNSSFYKSVGGAGAETEKNPFKVAVEPQGSVEKRRRLAEMMGKEEEEEVVVRVNDEDLDI